VTVTVLGVKSGKQVSLGIHAPQSVPVHREEISKEAAQETLVPAEPPDPAPDKPPVKVVIRNRKRQWVRTETGE
jgi:sRNA-binding carbon storage regulator CsrA